jgi:hypothetical protein
MNKDIVWISGILGFLLMGLAGLSLLSAGQATAEQKEMEAYLKNAKFNPSDIQKGGLGGRNEPWRISLNDGKTARKGIFKYIDRPERRLNPVSYKREIAAYELTKLFAMDIVPPVIEREVLGIKGSLQIMVEGCVSERDRLALKMVPPDPQAFENKMEELNVFENFTYCPRDPKDVLIHKNTWKVCRVDFMEAFDTLSELLPETTISRCSRRLYQGLQLDPKVIETALKSYLTTKEIKALLDRRTLILDKLQGLIKDKGEAAVLFEIKP